MKNVVIIWHVTSMYLVLSYCKKVMSVTYTEVKCFMKFSRMQNGTNRMRAQLCFEKLLIIFVEIVIIRYWQLHCNVLPSVIFSAVNYDNFFLMKINSSKNLLFDPYLYCEHFLINHTAGSLFSFYSNIIYISHYHERYIHLHRLICNLSYGKTQFNGCY